MVGQDTTHPLAGLGDWLALLPPEPICLSPMQIRLLLRVVLPQPILDLAAVVALITYQQRHKQAAYRAHRLQRLLSALRQITAATVPRAGYLASTLALPRGPPVSL
jgi:hypothetical protein